MRTHALLDWYRSGARDLPWRSDPRDPYHVLVSEFMLQQTQVDRVAPRFVGFIERFPTITDLAAATEDEVLAAWSGLGYYRRARNLHRVAQEAAGSLPKTAADLERLPGIGAYTAAAIASLAFGEAVPVLDGNVMRVGARVLAIQADPRSAEGRRLLENWILGLMKGESPAEINEALMELGATVCVPVGPACDRCPLGPDCDARDEGRQQDYPPPRRRRRTVSVHWVAACIVDADGAWLVRKVDKGPILRDLWLPPLVELADGADSVREAARLLAFGATSPPRRGLTVRHNITHRSIDVIPVRFEVARAEPPSGVWRWIDPSRPGVATSSLLAKLVAAFAK